MVPGTIIEGPDAWYAADYKDQPEKFVYVLKPQDIAELDAAVAKFLATGKDLKVCCAWAAAVLRPPIKGLACWVGGGLLETCATTSIASPRFMQPACMPPH